MAKGLIIFATAAHLLVYVYAMPEHIFDSSWPPHARFHVLQSLLWIIGLNSILFSVTLKFFENPSRLLWWTLFGGWVFVHWGYFVSFLVGGPPPEISTHILLFVLLLLYGWGLFVSLVKSKI